MSIIDNPFNTVDMESQTSTINITTKITALKSFFESMKILREENIVTNKKDFTCQIGEWLVEILYNGKRAKSGIQKGWDVIVDGKHIQVKAHSKAVGNNNRWSAVEKQSSETIDELIIIVFTFDYKLKEFYRIPWVEALPHIKLRGKKKPRHELSWSKVKHFRLENSELPHQEIVSFLS